MATTPTPITAAAPSLPTLPAIPIPVSGDTLTIGLWAVGVLFTYACTTAGQKMAEAAVEGTEAFNSKLAALVGHVESWFGALKKKL